MLAAGRWPPQADEPTGYCCRTCRRTPQLPNWCAWPRSDGGSSTITASSSTASGWTTSKAAHSPAGTVTSPSPSSPKPSAPCSAATQKSCAGMSLYQVLRSCSLSDPHPRHLPACCQLKNKLNNSRLTRNRSRGGRLIHHLCGRGPAICPCVPPVPERGKTARQSHCFPQPGRAVGLILTGTPSSRLSCPGAQLLAATGKYRVRHRSAP